MPLLFLHVPRTAGTTLNSILTRQYPGLAAMKMPNYPEPATLTQRLTDHLQKNDGRPPDVCRGHVNFGMHRQIPGRYFSMVRNPVERVISHYWFARCKNSDTVKNADGEFMSLEEFVDPDRLGIDVTNMQSRMFAGTYRLYRTDSSQSSLDGFESPDALYRAAVKNLEYFDAVGMTERFDETMVLFQHVFGWQMPVYVSHNVVIDRPRLHLHDLAERIRTVNDVDMAFYEEVSQRFEATWKSQFKHLVPAKMRFDQAQEQYKREHQSQRSRRIDEHAALPTRTTQANTDALANSISRRAA